MRSLAGFGGHCRQHFLFPFPFSLLRDAEMRRIHKIQGLGLEEKEKNPFHNKKGFPERKKRIKKWKFKTRGFSSILLLRLLIFEFFLLFCLFFRESKLVTVTSRSKKAELAMHGSFFASRVSGLKKEERSLCPLPPPPSTHKILLFYSFFEFFFSIFSRWRTRVCVLFFLARGCFWWEGC